MTPAARKANKPARCEQNGNHDSVRSRPIDDSSPQSLDCKPLAPMSAARLEKLNPQQRRAVEHGGSALADAPPLLIIAGAGSGKTSTLAHRVAFLIEQGADPRRIMLLTFSRRAAAEMTRRVDRILAGAAQERGGGPIETMAWAGTFHAIGARLLREYAETIGLVPGLHDPRSRGFGGSDESRPPRSRFLQNRQALSDQRHLPRHLFARGEQRSAARRGSRLVLSVVRDVAGRIAGAVRAVCRNQAAAARARLRRSPALLGAHDAGRRDRRRDRGALRSCAGRRISGHQQAAGLGAAGAPARRQGPDRRRRRRAIDLFVSRGDGAQHPRLSRPFPPARRGRDARAELSLDAADPGGRQRGDRTGRGALHQESVVGAKVGRAAASGQRARRGRSGALRRRESSRKPRARASRSKRKPCCSAPRIIPVRWKWS